MSKHGKRWRFIEFNEHQVEWNKAKLSIRNVRSNIIFPGDMVITSIRQLLYDTSFFKSASPVIFWNSLFIHPFIIYILQIQPVTFPQGNGWLGWHPNWIWIRAVIVRGEVSNIRPWRAQYSLLSVALKCKVHMRFRKRWKLKTESSTVDLGMT